ncbi:PREDICTED: emerin-like [Galeopterus variegatus]|uniref:Emerin-like n=1 Tax=Galeopterus variegatus TaxID=482537 RepID=A0ABM0SHQ3_GALVR|nr:PREDICTED: emerin-like [Galeopterus variegatus]
MDDSAVVSDPELAALPRQFTPHENVLGSTNNLLEEEIFKYMTQRRRRLSPSNSSASSYRFSDLDSAHEDSSDMYNLPKKEDTSLDQSKGCNEEYYEESCLTTRTSREADSVGTSKGFHQLVTLLSDADTFHHQIQDDSLLSSSEEESKDREHPVYSLDSAYQSVEHYRHVSSISKSSQDLSYYPTSSSSSSLSSSSCSCPSCLTGYTIQPGEQALRVPLWGQLLLFLLLNAILLFVYYYWVLQDGNPFWM